MSTTDIDLKGKTALVTGASSGIGESLARLLASRGADLIVVARRADRLEALGRELSDKHKVKVRVVAQDLAVPGAAAELFDKTEGQGQRVDLLMNNAGFGTQEFFLDIPWERTTQEIQLNITALTELAYRFGRAMRERKQGWLLNVASIAAYVPTSTMATYAAGKAYVLHFSQALGHELRGHGVQVTCVCPGGTVTEFQARANQYIGPGFG
ncbi:MAG TPA: SDR family oxidoreductase, partial [Myxococcaceae bacterium]|nr:SDR family oxidoreductase [Myxococcaceae bacterium]